MDKRNQGGTYMVKLVYCLRRRSDIGVEQCHQYWLEKHGPLVRSFAETLRARRYVQSHLLQTPLNALIQKARGTQEPYDGITEVWWDSVEDVTEALNTPKGQHANLLLLEDEDRFCDLAHSSVFFTQEHTIF
jgi:uncharacterized protein (TIGR02118 family)